MGVGAILAEVFVRTRLCDQVAARSLGLGAVVHSAKSSGDVDEPLVTEAYVDPTQSHLNGRTLNLNDVIAVQDSPELVTEALNYRSDVRADHGQGHPLPPHPSRER